MEPDYWHQRWQENLTGFHKGGINPRLEAYWPRLPLAAGDPVFVPLCGKSLDLLWLGQRHPVTGVELSPIAVEAFFRDHGLVPEHRRDGAFEVCESERIRLLCGDFFDLRPVQLQGVRGVYDRAALVALPAGMRRRYVETLNRLLPPPPVSMLLVTLEYPQEQMDGPPFSVSDEEVKALFADQWRIERLASEDVLAGEPRFREKGLSRLVETAFLLQRRVGHESR